MSWQVHIIQENTVGKVNENVGCAESYEDAETIAQEQLVSLVTAGPIRDGDVFRVVIDEIDSFKAYVDNIGMVGEFTSKEAAIAQVESTIANSARADDHGFVLENGELVWEVGEGAGQ